MRDNLLIDRSRIYGEMVSDIYDDLLNGRLKMGDRLPTEADFRRRYNISVTSVRKGIEEFVSKGILSRRRGSGMYVEKLPEALRPSVRKDTIALFHTFELNAYHPFYTEFFRALDEILIQRGWKIKHVRSDLKKSDDSRYEINLDGYDLAHPAMQELMNSPEVAGAILSPYFADEFLDGCRKLFPIVVSGKHPVHPYVSNDMSEQLLQAFRLVIRRGAANVLFVGSDKPDVRSMIRKALCLEDREKDVKHVVCKMTGDQRIYSKFTHEAYQKALDCLAKEKGIDAIITDNEFALQGVLDAVSVLQRKSSSREFRIASIVNEKSNIHGTIKFDKVVADPRLFATKLVELLDQHIYSPDEAPASIDINSVVARG